MEKFKLELVEGWQNAWRWWSMWMHVIGTTLGGVLVLMPTMPDEVQAMVPVEYRVTAIALWAVMGVIARVVAQPKKEQ